MKLDTSGVQLQIPCPNCQQKIPETIGRLKANPDITCSGCGSAIHVDTTKFGQGIESTEKMLADLRKTLKKGFK